MKKIILSLSIVLLITSNAFAAYESPYKEEKLDLKSFTPEELQQVKKEREYSENLQRQLESEGQDYSYRMKQQMMQPQNWNPYGGYRY